MKKIITPLYFLYIDNDYGETLAETPMFKSKEDLTKYQEESISEGLDSKYWNRWQEQETELIEYVLES